ATVSVEDVRVGDGRLRDGFSEHRREEFHVVPKVQPIPEASKATRGRRTASTLAEINVVPLVDVMLVLLIIFMVTAPMIQRGIDVNLPVARRAPQISGERIEITVPASYPTDPMVYLGTEPIPRTTLQ